MHTHSASTESGGQPHRSPSPARGSQAASGRYGWNSPRCRSRCSSSPMMGTRKLPPRRRDPRDRRDETVEPNLPPDLRVVPRRSRMEGSFFLIPWAAAHGVLPAGRARNTGTFIQIGALPPPVNPVGARATHTCSGPPLCVLRVPLRRGSSGDRGPRARPACPRQGRPQVRPPAGRTTCQRPGSPG